MAASWSTLVPSPEILTEPAEPHMAPWLTSHHWAMAISKAQQPHSCGLGFFFGLGDGDLPRPKASPKWLQAPSNWIHTYIFIIYNAVSQCAPEQLLQCSYYNAVTMGVSTTFGFRQEKFVAAKCSAKKIVPSSSLSTPWTILNPP
jgi:hypothetical protein